MKNNDEISKDDNKINQEESYTKIVQQVENILVEIANINKTIAKLSVQQSYKIDYEWSENYNGVSKKVTITPIQNYSE